MSAPWVVVLAGGVGSRFWPLSTPARPKQLLPLASSQPLLRDTLERLLPLAPMDQMLVLTNAGLVPAIRELAPELPAENLIAEPRPAGTAAALAWAAHEIEKRAGREAVMISVHADWAVADPAGFRETLQQAAELAEEHHCLVTVGIVPTRPDPGFGYIQPGAAAGGRARRVKRFVEKPSRERALSMMHHGHLWNSGIFVWRVGDFLDEVRAHTPEVAPALAEAGDDMQRFFASVKSVPVDVGVLERTNHLLVIPGDFGWDDVGTWAALQRVRERDAQDNAFSGPVHAVDARANVVYSDGNPVVLYGVSGLVVVARDGLTLVTSTERAADLKTLIESLPSDIRDRT